MGRTGTGVEIRDASIRIRFVINGETYKERLTVNGKALPPNSPANRKYAASVAKEIQRRILNGTFDYAEFFPDSKRGQKQIKDAPTLENIADLWLQSKGQMSAATRDQYATAVRFWKRLLGAETLLKDLDHKRLAAKIGGYPWPSAKTHNNYLIALRGIFKSEYHGAKVLENPINGIENMTLVKKPPDPLVALERDRILEDMRQHYDPRVVAYFKWQFFTGMRPEETIALRWSDIDWTRRVARVQRVRTFKGSERDETKTKIVRDVDLIPQAIEALMEMKAHTMMLKTERQDQDDHTADVFQNPTTLRPWHDERSQREHYWLPTLKRLGIRRRRAYATRHTYATVALMAGIPPAYIADQLGHSVKILLETYARWIPGADNGETRTKLAAAMAGNSSQINPSAEAAKNKKASSR